MKLKLLKSFKDFEILPYDEDTRPWHIWLDMTQAEKVTKGQEFTIEEIAKANGMPVTYYLNSFDELLADEVVTIIEE